MIRFLRRLRALLTHRRDDADLAREMESHLAMLEASYQQRGMTPDEARLSARRAMGSVALAKDLHRDARSFVWLEDVRRDVRHATRALRRNPGFALLAVFALGLGIGVNTAFFTIVDAICLRGLPIDDPDRVMFVSARDAQDRPLSFSYAEFDDIRQHATAFQRVAAYTNTIASVADHRQPPARVLGAYVSAGAFELIGHRPLLGRTFRADEDNPGAPAVVIIGSELWSSRYASDPGMVGQTITVNGVPSTVIGVMPRGFMFPANADLWRPMANLPAAVRESRERRLAVFARLADGATEEQARVDMASLREAWSREWPDTNRDVRTRVVPINEQLNPSVAQRAWIAFIVAGALVLLVACANVANLLLMRAATRGREMAIRTSIGASRGRVVRQLLVESATLSALAGGLGVFVAWGGLRMLSSIIPPEAMPYWMAFTMDGRVLAMLLGVCLLCVFLCGMPSALHVSKMDLRDTLTDGGTTTAARPARRWIATLLAAEFAVTLVLVAMGVMSMRAGAETRRTEFQIDPASLITMWVTLPSDEYRTPAARAAFFDRVVGAVGGSASAGSVAFASALPNSGGGQQPLIISGHSAEKPPLVWVVNASEEYFAVLRVPLVRGRAFTLFDGRPGSEAAIVNERFVRMFLGNQEPIGTRIRVGAGETPWLQIVGVATTVRQQQLIGPEPDPVVFVPFRPAPPGTTAIVVRNADQDATIVRVRQEIARIDLNLPVYRIMSYEQAVRNAAWNSRLSDVSIKSIAVIALLLALVGLYAVTSHTVEGWRRELGMRIALGASAGHIGWLVLRRVLTQLAVGLALGLVGALAFDRTFNDPANRGATNVSMVDPGALLLILLAMCSVAVVACLVPIRRAARVDPLVALRAE
jgi:putative ABC transport system permease protein